MIDLVLDDDHRTWDIDLTLFLCFSMPSGWPTSLQLVKDLDRTNCSIKSEESTSTDELDDDQNNDGEGVWSADIEQSFHVRSHLLYDISFCIHMMIDHCRRHWLFIPHVVEGKSFYLMKEKCSVEMN